VQTFFTFLVLGLTFSAVYAISATGLVVTYITSGVFNFAHGAIGMFLAFVYWELRVNRGWPTPLALLVTLGVVAPIIGVTLDALVMRRLLRGASVATKLVVTLALLLSFQGLARTIWGIELRAVPALWGDSTFRVAGVNITYDQATTVLTALGVAFGLRILFKRTRLGVAMRAVVDNPELCAVKGSSPNRITAASWALGSMLAGLAAILIAPGLNLEVNTLSLLVVQAYAAAVVGRLQSLPATFVGAIALGVGQSMVVGYLPQDNEIVRNLKSALPFILLFGALLLFAERRLPEKAPTHAEPDPPSWRFTVGLGAATVVAAWVVSGQLSDFHLLIGSKGFLYSCITLSLVLLTGLSGQVSLMPMSFAGVGAVVIGELGTDVPWVAGFAIAAVVTGIVGCLVALPVLRLRGIYLALLTLACAILMDSLFFGNSNILGGGETLPVPRPSLFGLDFSSERSMFVVCAIACVVFANVFLTVRRSALGRMLNALRDSPTACQTMGLSLVRIKLAAFGMSALLAGAAGALLGALQVRVGQLDFFYFRSLAVLLVATIFGITTVSGALLGALFFVVLPELLNGVGADDKSSQALQPLIIGLLAMYAARNVGGISGQIRNAARSRLHRARRVLRRQPAAVDPVGAPVNA
jgi:branched-chain amino acid transport system permease protein